MSTFFKALERAEQERALRHPTPSPAPAAAATPAVSAAPASPATPVAPAPTTLPQTESAPSAAHPVFTQPRPVVAPRPAVAPGPEDHERGLEEHLVSLLAPTSFAAEQYRALRHVVEQLHRSSDLSVIAVSSPDAADGKTTTAINLAGALAQASDARVLLVDADFRGANMATLLGLDADAAPGLVEAILDPKLTLAAVVQVRPDVNLSILPAGRRPSAPYEMLKSPRVAELLAEARAKYDYVIVDTPPLVSVPDTRVTGKLVDGFLIVVAANRTPRRLLEEALTLMEPAKVIGMVFNGDARHLSRDSSSSRRRSVVHSRTSRRRIVSDD
jgi:capsular exopolysaccharide synthesis family protein